MSAEDFYREYITKIFTEKKNILDIGGGLRVSKQRGNWHSPKSAWITPLLSGVTYKIMDPVATYHPDIVGDIHAMPFADNSQDAIICMSVLEHVENPIQASKELFRVLAPGGYCFVYVPFLYYYHAEKGYYGDFWRFTRDSIAFLFKDFSKISICQTTGALEMWLKISPLGRFTVLCAVARSLDGVLGKRQSNQTSGYNVFLTK